MKVDRINKMSLISKILFCVVLQGSLVSCSSYTSSFSCPDAKGGRCLAMDKIDHLINSGEIEKITGVDNSCKGKKCSSKGKSKFLNREKQLPALKETTSTSVYFPEESGERK
jgi:hypothetical protein